MKTSSTYIKHRAAENPNHVARTCRYNNAEKTLRHMDTRGPQEHGGHRVENTDTWSGLARHAGHNTPIDMTETKKPLKCLTISGA